MSTTLKILPIGACLLGFFLAGCGVMNNPDWKIADTGTAPALSSVAWTGSQLVAVGGGGAFTSTDGITWTPRDVGVPGLVLSSVIWADGQLIAVGSHGTNYEMAILTSPDAVTWTNRATGTGGRLASVAWSGNPASGGSGKLAAAGGNTVLLSADNGVTWTGGEIGPNSISLNAITWADGRFMAVGKEEICNPAPEYGCATNALVATSPDGTAWTKRNGGEDGLGGLASVIWTGSRYIALGSGQGYSTSKDGIAWTTRFVSRIYPITCMAWTGSRVIALGNKAVPGEKEYESRYKTAILTSIDGESWDKDVTDLDASFSSAAWAGDRLVAVGAKVLRWDSENGDVVEPISAVVRAEGGSAALLAP